MRTVPLATPRQSLMALLSISQSLSGLSYAQTNQTKIVQTQTVQTQTVQTQTVQTQTVQTQNFTLDAALALLASSPSVTQAQLSVQVAQSNLNAARTALGLVVSVTGSGNYVGSSTSTVAGVSTSTDSSLNGSAGVNVSLGILPWSSNQTSLKTSQRSLTLAEARLLEAQNTTKLNVAQQYLAAVIASQDVSLANQTLTLKQRQLTVAQTQQANGNATAESVLSAKANVQTAQAGQLQAASSLDAAKRSLSAALGTEIGNVSFSTQPSETTTLPDITALVNQARANRREVIEARNTLISAQETLDQQKRDSALPDITASLRYGPASSGGLNANFSLTQGTLGGGYSIPLNSASSSSDRISASISGTYVVYSPAVKAQLSAAEATVVQAQLSLSVAQQTIELDLRTKYSTLQTSLITLQTQATQQQVAQLTLDSAKTRLQAGTGTQDEVSSAELNLAQASRALLSARATAQTNLIQLQNAAGGTQ